MAIANANAEESVRRSLSCRAFSVPIGLEPCPDADVELVSSQRSTRALNGGSSSENEIISLVSLETEPSRSRNAHAIAQKWRRLFDPLHGAGAGADAASSFAFAVPVPEQFRDVDFTQLALMNGLDWRTLGLTDAKKLSDSQCSLLDRMCALGQLELLTLQTEAEVRARSRGTASAVARGGNCSVRGASNANASPALGNRGRRCTHDCSQPACAGDCAGRAVSTRRTRSRQLRQPILCRACGQFYASNCAAPSSSAIASRGPYESYARCSCAPKASASAPVPSQSRVAPSASNANGREHSGHLQVPLQVLTSGSANNASSRSGRPLTCRANTPASGSSASGPPTSSAIASARTRENVPQPFPLATIETHVVGARAEDALPRAPPFLVDPSVLSKLARTPSSTRIVLPLTAAAASAATSAPVSSSAGHVHAASITMLGTCVSRKPLTARSAAAVRPAAPGSAAARPSSHLSSANTNTIYSHVLDLNYECVDTRPPIARANASTPSRVSLAVGKRSVQLCSCYRTDY